MKINIPDQQLIDSYRRTGSVWQTGVEFGLPGQNVHRRLSQLGVVKHMRVLTEDEKWLIRALYREGFQAGDGKLKGLAKSIKRTVPFISRFAHSEGLTSYCRPKAAPLCAAMGARTKAYIENNGHPRGALGMKHSEATLKLIGKKSAAAWRRMSYEQKTDRSIKIAKTRIAHYGNGFFNRANASWKAAWREVAGKKIYFRSRWEFNYALYLQFLLEHGQISSWEHEPVTFWFEGVRRGTVSYLPDFRVTIPGGAVEYHEVKGWMDARSKTKLRRMAKYHPHVRIKVIDSNWFGVNARKLAGLLAGWETMKPPKVKPHTPELL